MAGHEVKLPKQYRRFKTETTAVLETLLNYVINKGNEELKSALHKAEEVVARIAILGASSADIQNRLMQVWEPEIRQSQEWIKRLSKAAYVLSKAAEIEALGRSLPGVRSAVMSKGEVTTATTKPNQLGPVSDRVHLAYERLAAKLAHAVRLGKVLNDNPKEMIDRMRRYYPEKRVVKRGRRPLAKPLREDAKPLQLRRDAIDMDFYDEDEWNALTDLLQDMELDEGRFGQQAMEEYGVDRYRFEFEQEATEEFVDKVRAGEIQAANDQGIDEFVWAAVIDKKTCEECCEKRDGMLTSEIETKLAGPWKDDDCGAVVPPAHPNCFIAGTPITTAAGRIPIEDIFPGNIVLTHRGRWKKVQRTLQSLANELVEVVCNGVTMHMTPEHPMLVSRDGVYSWMTAESMREGDLLIEVGSAQKNDISCTKPQDYTFHDA